MSGQTSAGVGEERQTGLLELLQETTPLPQNLNSALATFSPTEAVTSRFVELSKDTNPLHKQRLDGMPGTIVPGFLTYCAGVLLSRVPIRQIGLTPIDYPFSMDTFKLRAPMFPGQEYSAGATIEPINNKQKINAEVNFNLKGKSCGTLERVLSKHLPGEFFPANSGEIVHTGNYSLLERENLAYGAGLFRGATDSPERHLLALSGSSFIIPEYLLSQAASLQKAEESGELDARGKAIFANLKLLAAGKVFAVYLGQKVWMDNNCPVDLRNGVKLDLSVQHPENFGVLNSPVRTLISAFNEQRQIYAVQSMLTFVDTATLMEQIRKAHN